MLAAGLIWDMDGVLVDSGPAHFAAWSRLAAELGKPFDEETFRRTFGLRNDAILRVLHGDEPLAEDELWREAARKEEYFRDAVRGHVQALPGAVALVRAAAAAGYRQAVGSSAPQANLELILDELDIRACFSAWVGEEDVKRGKPAPDIYLLAASRLGLPPGRCLVIEDAVAGVEGAHAAGMRCLAVTTTRTAAELAQADRVVASLTEVDVAALGKLLADFPSVSEG